jgi:hypothetical protein
VADLFAMPGKAYGMGIAPDPGWWLCLQDSSPTEEPVMAIVAWIVVGLVTRLPASMLARDPRTQP